MDSQSDNQTLDNSSLNDLKLVKDLNKAERENFLKSFDKVFCDCDGVLWKLMRHAIPGSAAGIEFLRKCGKQVTFVTNNSIIAPEEQLGKFKLCDITVAKNEIVHPAQTICDHLRGIRFEGLIYCLASSSFKRLLREEGFQLVEERNRIISETIEELYGAIYSTDIVKAVVIDVDFNLTAVKLMRAHVHLRNPECLFIGGAADPLLPFPGGDVIGPGHFIRLLEQSTRRTAIILGKPGEHLREHLKARFDIKNTRRALFIGDSLSSDIKFGKMCGFQTLLVLSGGTKLSDLKAPISHDMLPDYVLDCLGDFPELLNY